MYLHAAFWLSCVSLAVAMLAAGFTGLQWWATSGQWWRKLFHFWCHQKSPSQNAGNDTPYSPSHEQPSSQDSEIAIATEVAALSHDVVNQLKANREEQEREDGRSISLAKWTLRFVIATTILIGVQDIIFYTTMIERLTRVLTTS
jgi:hypothetical protein